MQEMCVYVEQILTLYVQVQWIAFTVALLIIADARVNPSSTASDTLQHQALITYYRSGRRVVIQRIALWMRNQTRSRCAAVNKFVKRGSDRQVIGLLKLARDYLPNRRSKDTFERRGRKKKRSEQSFFPDKKLTKRLARVMQNDKW